MKKINKNKKLEHTIAGSPSRKLELNNNFIVLKRTGTNNIEKNSELCTSPKSKSIDLIKKKTRRKSLKFIEKNIKNRLLDISIQIEKEENISCINPRDNKLNISTLIKNKINIGSEISTPKNILSVKIDIVIRDLHL